tara:strand:+ start:100 stop:735 length:636 start_codon:yes stop_codon:yes gene_type:complete
MSIKERFKNLASSGLNKLPASANLFLRYYTGLGSKGLDLSDEYLSNVREQTKSADMNSGRFDKEFIDEKGDRVMGRRLSFLDFPSDLPRFGQVDPYGTGNQDVIQTLGRFQSTPQADGKFVNIRDTYDMVNQQEDPDLVSGKFQLVKALQELGRGIKGFSGNKQGPYGFETSPKTRLARAAMYLTPVKFKPFDINIDIPMTGDINNREIYR